MPAWCCARADQAATQAVPEEKARAAHVDKPIDVDRLVAQINAWLK